MVADQPSGGSHVSISRDIRVASDREVPVRHPDRRDPGVRRVERRRDARRGQFGDLHRYPVHADGGPSEIVEYTLGWTENGVPHAGHHVHLLTVHDDLIVADTVFCGGRWPASLLAEMEAADA